MSLSFAHTKTALITGGNTGIGFETAVALAGKGFHTIIACRNPEKGKAAVEHIRSCAPDAHIECQALDLADFSSIREFAEQRLASKTPIDVLVNNAGVMACPQMKTKDGHEMQIGTNHFGHVLLTSLLYPLMRKHKEEARIVVVSSSAHKQAWLTKGVNFDDINSEKSYSRWPAYSQSKLANILFTYEMARRIPKEDKVTVNVCHPGVVATELARHLVPENPNFLLKPLISLFFSSIKTPVQGASTQIYLSSSPEVAGVTGKYFVDSKQTRSSAVSYEEEAAKKLWELSNSITGAEWDF